MALLWREPKLKEVTGRTAWRIRHLAQWGSRSPRVYVITCGEKYVKVGYAKNVPLRMINLQIGNPIKLRLAFQSRTLHVAQATGAESYVKKALKDKRVSGEWYECSPKEAISLVQKYLWPGRRRRPLQ